MWGIRFRVLRSLLFLVLGSKGCRCSVASNRTRVRWQDVASRGNAFKCITTPGLRHWSSIRFDFSRIAWFKAQRAGYLTVADADRTVVTGLAKAYSYDWPVVQRFYDEGHSSQKCCAKFGCSNSAWEKAVRRGAIVTRPREWSLERILASSTSRWTVKRRLLRAGIIVNRCEECGIAEWRGRPISIQIDHRNGVRNDHRLENLRMLCPNCHSQTETFGAKNKKRQAHSRFV